MSEVSLAEQIGCVGAALRRRVSAYPHLVAQQLMTQAWADIQIARMQAVLRTLEQVADGERPHNPDIIFSK